MIFTVGYQRLSPDALAELARQLDATVVDVRSVPTSRKRGFGRHQLASLLGARYVWRGDMLGGRAPERPRWAEGLEWLRAQPGNLLLLCLEEAPADCHRHEIALALGAPVAHVYQVEVIEAAELERSCREGTDYECELLDDIVPHLVPLDGELSLDECERRYNG